MAFMININVEQLPKCLAKNSGSFCMWLCLPKSLEASPGFSAGRRERREEDDDVCVCGGCVSRASHSALTPLARA